MTTELTKQEALDLVSAFVDKVKSGPKNYVDDIGYIDGESSNRGNKLKFGAQLVHRDRLNGFNNDIEVIEPVEYNRSTRTVFKRRRLDAYNYEDPEYEGEDAEDNPYLDIDLEEILRPINHPSELSKREPISRTYTTRILKHYAQQSIEIIEKEQHSVNKLTELLGLFLGEDSNVLLEDGLKLPEYNHHLKETPDAESPSNNNDKEKGVDKRVTRKSVTDEADPFFLLPQFEINNDQGLSKKKAESARQMTQLAVQRTEQFIASLTKVRNGFVRAQTIKDKLYAWAKEMNGDPDESDLYVREKEANARAAQEAKEAKDAKLGIEVSSSSNDGSATPQPTARRGGRRRAQN